MRYGFDKRADGLGRFAWWVQFERLSVELEGPWSWALQVYLSRRAFQVQVLWWIFQVEWW